jgi:preprotein translocase subunit SecG
LITLFLAFFISYFVLHFVSRKKELKEVDMAKTTTQKEKGDLGKSHFYFTLVL